MTNSAKRTKSYLEEHGIAYKVFDHARCTHAADAARACGVASWQAAKSIVLLNELGHWVLAVIPASERLDLARLRVLLHSPTLRIATKAELRARFPDLELTAIPPFASMLGASGIVDERLLDGRRVLCNGGDPCLSLLVEPDDLLARAGGRIEDVCEARAAAT